MDAGHTNYILVDVRSEEEYRSGHIIGAINIPVYRSPNSSINLDTDVDEAAAIVENFRALPKDKEIIIYCYSAACMSGRKVGKLLAENGIYVKILNIGWNEWRYYWNMWNHEGETAKVEDYIASGPEPGTVVKKNNSPSCSSGGFGC
jgi:rhodanese-related sulfurtransferase